MRKSEHYRAIIPRGSDAECSQDGAIIAKLIIDCQLDILTFFPIKLALSNIIALNSK